MIRRAFLLGALLAVAAPVLAAPPDELKVPKITPLPAAEVARPAFKFAKDESETYLTTTRMSSAIKINAAGQDMDMKISGDTRILMRVKCLETEPNAKLQVTYEHVNVDQDMDLSIMQMRVVARDDKMKVYRGDDVIHDPEKGITDPMAEQVTKQMSLYKKQGTLSIDADGRMVGKVEGAPEFVQVMNMMPNSALFPVMFKGQEKLAVGDTWQIETEMAENQNMKFSKPLKIVNTYKVVGLASVEGVECVDLQCTSVAKGKSMQVQMKQGEMEIPMTMDDVSTNVTGHVYFDAKSGKVVFADLSGPFMMAGSGEVASAGVKIGMELEARMRVLYQRNVPMPK